MVLPYMITGIVIDHIWTPYMIMSAGLRECPYMSPYGQSYMVGPYMIIYGNHIWPRYMILIYEHPSESYTEFLWDDVPEDVYDIF